MARAGGGLRRAASAGGAELNEPRPHRRPASRTVLQGGRQKAFRPLPAADRRAALAAGVAAYERGDFFEAHELLEPAWMGTDDLGERALYQGLIKLAAAYVHAVRGNPAGVRRNLEGARLHLVAATVRDDDPVTIDLRPLLDAVDRRLEPGGEALPPPAVRGA